MRKGDQYQVCIELFCVDGTCDVCHPRRTGARADTILYCNITNDFRIAVRNVAGINWFG